MTKKESLKYQIEQLCRQYVQAGENERQRIEDQIRQAREELQDLLVRRGGDPGDGMRHRQKGNHRHRD